MSRAFPIVACMAALASGCAAGAGQLAAGGDPASLRKQLAATLIAHRAFAAATQPLRDLVVMKPRDPDVRVMLGDVYREQGLHDESEREYRFALQLDGRRADAHSGIGILFEARGDGADKAIDEFRKAIELQPGQPAFYNNLGFALYKRGRDLEAIEAYRKGLQQDPTVRRMRNNLGFAYGRLGHWNHAKREFYRAGSKGEAENNLGHVYEQSGDAPAACDRYREAARLEPTLAVVQANLARTCGTGPPALRTAAVTSPAAPDGPPSVPPSSVPPPRSRP
ncbi:MAG: tetratricopeptide repeat protein [Myxococcales bacterium]|nr:tetratricopeptide repeat protein [Myxococcales bacterium]